ncbi:MAG: YciI family protein [Granulosicoccus sp.]
MTDKTPEALTATMLRKELYVITTKPARSPEIKSQLPVHLEYQIKLEKEGTMFGAGPIYEEGDELPAGGMIIIRAANFEEAHQIADQDPLHQQGLRSYTVTKWLLNEGSMTFTVRYSDQTMIVEN